MDFQSFKNEFGSMLEVLLAKELWLDITQEKQETIFKRAHFDIANYLQQNNCELNDTNPTVKQAVFEQTLHLARQSAETDSARIVIEESVTGFGSRKYRECNNAMLCERAVAYLQIFIKHPARIHLIH